VTRPDVNLQDLSGTDLEEAETAIFKQAIAEDLRLTTWIGNVDAAGDHDTFDGILRKVAIACEVEAYPAVIFPDAISSANVIEALESVWESATDELKLLKKDGQLVFYVTSDFYRAYEQYVYECNIENGNPNYTEAVTTLYYRGIPLEDIGVTVQMLENNGLEASQCLLTDRRNLVLALNTADYPDAEVRMWYNPDMMENRQRAVFLAAADFIDFDLVSLGHE
jgi:hypothetical protein